MAALTKIGIVHARNTEETPMTDEAFDINTHFDQLASQEDNTVKGELYRLLYRIDSICRANWQTMPSDVQSEIIDTVSKALEVVRSLPSGVK